MNRWLWTSSKEIKQWLPKLQSHRGYWSDGTRENTLSAIQNSVRLGYEMIEFDVRLTADLIVILFHDETFNNELIAELNFADLQSKNPTTTLDDALNWLASHGNQRIKFNIELKTHLVFNSELENRVVDLIQKYDLQQRVLISSFNPFALAHIRWLDHSIYRALLLTYETHPKNKWYFKKMLLNIFCRPHALNLFYKDWNHVKFKSWVKDIPIILWTYNENIMDLDPKVHGIISDTIMPIHFQK